MLTSKLIEMVPNVEGLIIVPSILVVNELYISCKEKQYFLDRETGSKVKMLMLTFFLITQKAKAFRFMLIFFFLTCWLLSQKVGRGVRACILRTARL